MRSPIARAVVVVLMCATPAAGVSFQPDAPGVNGFTTVDKVTWKDSKGLDREFYFAKSYPNAIAPGLKGYVTRLTWQPDLAHPRIIAEEDPSGINTSTSQGWGLNVMHMHWLQYGGVDPIFGSGQSATTGKRDGFDFHQAPVLLGPHHLIFRVTYKQYTTLQKATPDDRKWVQVTTDWFFADGLDFVVFAHTIDASAGIESDPVRFLNNTLAPYSLLASAGWKGTTDWAGGTDAPDGQSFGDFKVFVTNDMQTWTYGGTNTIPFVWEWVTPLSGRGDAEAAFVQTETYAQKNAGEGFAWGQDAQGTRMPQYPDLNGQECAYQMNFFDSYGTKRMTWGTQIGALYGGFGSTRGFQNYSLAMLLGKYSEHGASELISETASIHDGMLQVHALVGTLVTSGPEGSGNATTHVYSPAGYNHVYRTWEARAEGNVVRLRFDTGAGTYKRPTLVVRDFTAAEATVMLNGAPAEVSATLDDAGDVLWVTLLATLSGSNVIDVSGVGACAPSCPAGSCGGDGCGGTCACAAGAVCLADLTCCQPNAEACGPDGCGGSHGECASCTPNDAGCGPDGCGGTHGECPPVCTPACVPGSCGGDGCGGTCACASGAVCLVNGTCCQPNTETCGPDGCGGTHGACPPVCTPACAPLSCGGDGCGGICVCTSGTVCLVDGTCCQPNTASCGPDGCGGTHGVCPPVCTPSCAPGTCGGDGCGGLCVCTSGTVCVADGTCCQPNAASCGPDGCGGSHGVCPPVCTPSCAPGSCGSDGCGGLCVCSSGTVCVADGTCCQPNTASCGPDGCGGSHGVCPPVCTPSCAPGTCGGDGCGGLCVCTSGTVCVADGTCCQPNTASCGPDGCGGSHGVCPPICTPSCAPGSCGSDGCGGICACSSGAVCLADATCCQPNTATCGADGCGGTHGECPACIPNNNACGPDGCGGTHGPGWDPAFGTFSSTPTTTRVQFSVHDTTVVTLKLELGGAAPRTLLLGSRTAVSGGYLRFTATASPAIVAGTLVRLKATQSLAAGAKTATSTWFAYLQGAPALTCEVACVPACLPETCGSDGCGGTCGCATGSVCLGGSSLMCCHPNSNACGPDGCGGTHGACPPACTAGDADGDGVCDDRDNCRGCWNADQADVDRDGLGECWRCDWCSGPGTDTDWDGFCDRVDDCPATWNQSQFDHDGDGLGDACDPTP